MLLALAFASPAAAVTVPAGFEMRTLASGFNQSTAVAWTPDGRMLVAEKGGTVRLVEPGQQSHRQIIDIRSSVNAYGDRGLLGIAVDSSFATNRYVYLLYTRELQPLQPDGSGIMASRLTRHVMAANGDLGPGTTILGSYSGACPAPDNSVDCLPSEEDSHSIGTVRSAPDGTLYVGSGDAAAYGRVDPLALRTYDERSLAGKILHVDRNGRGLPGHGFCPTVTDLTKNCTKLHSKGFRNPFRFHLRPGNNGLLVGDVGWGTWEEIDVITQKGRSWGWPCYEGSSRTPGYSSYSECSAQYALEGGPQANLPPAFQYSHADEPRPGYGAVLPGPVYEGTAYPSSYRGTALFGDYAKGVLRRLEFDGDTVVRATDFGSGWYGVDLEASPQGNIVSVFFGDGSPGTGSVAELVYTAGNRAPIAVAGPDRSGTAPLQVAFDGGSSSDPDGDALTYSWDPGDGSAPLSGVRVNHTYATPGTYTATLTVDDGRGLTGSDTVRVDAGNSAPVASIASPVDGSTFRIGTNVTLQGSATDAQDGPLPASALTWQVNLIHGAHLHPVTTIVGQAQASFSPLADHDADSYYRVTLTARDSGGVTSSVTHTVVPQTSVLTLASSPPGAPVTIGSTSGVAPLAHTGAVGYRTTITAADSFVASGRRQVFTGWSDGGARSHDITVPAVDTQLTASYRDDGPVLPPGIQVAYGFEDGSGTTVDDITGNGHDATLTGGPAWVPDGRHGKALSFDGLDDLGTIADPGSVGLSGPHTISAWVRPRTLRSWQTVVLHEKPGSFNNALYATNGGSQGKINGWVGDDGLYAPPIVTDRWTHLALTFDGTTARLYVDGSVAATRVTAAAPAGTGPLRLGGNRVWPSETLDGLVDDVRIYNRALSAADIATDMATGLPGSGAPPPPPPPPPPADGLVLSLDFDEASGSTAVDGSGRGHDGTISGAVRTTAGHSGSALTFDGSGDRVTVADHIDLDLTSALTMEAWVRPDTTKTWQTILLKEAGSGIAYGVYATDGGTGKTNAWIGDLGAYSPSAIQTGRWTHVAATFEGGTLRLYRDGAQVGAITGVSAPPVSTGPLRIGDNSVWSGEGFDGRIDEVRLWSRALSASEIAATANAVPATASTATVRAAARSGASAKRSGRRVARRSNVRRACRRAKSPIVKLARVSKGRTVLFRPRSCPRSTHKTRSSTRRRVAKAERKARTTAKRRGPSDRRRGGER